MDKMKIYCVETNTDLTEGRGRQVTIALSSSPSTAIRVSKGQGVQGSDADTVMWEIPVIDGEPMVPLSLIKYRMWVEPTQEDRDRDLLENKYQETRMRALAAGLTEEDIQVLISRG